MRKYLNIYKEFIRTSTSEATSFRLNFILQNIMNACFMMTFFLISSFIFDHIEHIGVWNKMEFFFFLSFVFALDQTHYLMFSYNFWQFSEDVLTGKLDFHLLKPVSILFIIFSRQLAIPGITTALGAYIAMIYFGIQLDISLLSWLMIIPLMVLSMAFLVSLEIIIAMLNFVTVEGAGINQMRLQIQHFCRWPDFIYKNPIRLTIIPFLIITSFPVRFLLNNGDWLRVIYMCFTALLLFFIIYFLWPKMLNLYQSPSS